MKKSIAVASVLIGCLIGCSEDEVGEGTLHLELWGEPFIEDGIPAAAFADGYAVTFDKFLINLSAISVAKTKDTVTPALKVPNIKIWDLTQAGPFLLTSAMVPAGAYHHTAYGISKAGFESVSGNATEADVTLMIDGGFSVYASGSATNGDITKTFAWGFDAEKHYDPCHSEAVLTDGGQATVQITIHGDHLFYDCAVSSEPDLRFSDIALADANNNGEVTPEELAAYPITPLPNYNVGNLDIDTLWEFISHMTTTLGHIDGEGHCE
ncbi:MAG: hypothetical protein QNJ97_03825 [Myxococcota bacterium]|nr:hypothetical protein [Myxococcota bacterium]